MKDNVAVGFGRQINHDQNYYIGNFKAGMWDGWGMYFDEAKKNVVTAIWEKGQIKGSVKDVTKMPDGISKTFKPSKFRAIDFSANKNNNTH